MHDSGYILILFPVPISGKFKSLIPVPIPIPARSPPIPPFEISESDSDSSKNRADSGIYSDSGIGIAHHWYKHVLKQVKDTGSETLLGERNYFDVSKCTYTTFSISYIFARVSYISAAKFL